MRPNPGRADADSHLLPCPQCGSANGLNAHACWNCDAALASPDAAELPAPLGAQGARVPEFLAEKTDDTAPGTPAERRLAPVARRRNLFEAAVARMNGETDDPSDQWDEWEATAEPDPTSIEASFGKRTFIDVPSGGLSTTEDSSIGRPSASDLSPAVASDLDLPAEPTTAELSTVLRSTTGTSVSDTSTVHLPAAEGPTAEGMTPEGPTSESPTPKGPTAESPSAESPSPAGQIADEAYDVEVQAALRHADSAQDEALHDDGPRAGLPSGEAPVAEGAQVEIANIDIAAFGEPAVPSFADTPFDESRFSVKSFDSWPPDDGAAGSAAWDRDASHEGLSPAPAEATEARSADPFASGSAAPAAGIADSPAEAAPLVAGPIDDARPDIAVVTDLRAEPELSTGAQAMTGSEARAEPPSAASHVDFRAAADPLPEALAEPDAALHPFDDPLPARWQPRGARLGGADLFPAPATVAESEATPAGHAAASVWPEPPSVVASDPPFVVSNESPVAGAPSTPGRTDWPNALPPTSTDPLPIPPRSDPPVAKRRKASRSREESALQTFEDSFLAAGAHPSIHSDDDASFDSGRSGLGSTQPPVRGGRAVDPVRPLASARTERAGDSFRDEALGEKFAALASTSARAARRRRLVTIASLCGVAVVGFLAAYPFFGNGVRIDLSSDELRSAASTSTTPLAPTPLARVPEANPTAPAAGIANRTAPGAAAPAPAAPPRPAPPRLARNDADPAPTAQASGSEARPGRPPREVVERLARRQTPPVQAPADAAVASTADRNRSDGNRPRAEAAGSRPQAERLGAADEPPTDVRVNRRRAGDDPAAESGSITCTERILALNLCGPPTRKE